MALARAMALFLPNDISRIIQRTHIRVYMDGKSVLHRQIRIIGKVDFVGYIRGDYNTACNADDVRDIPAEWVYATHNGFFCDMYAMSEKMRQWVHCKYGVSCSDTLTRWKRWTIAHNLLKISGDRYPEIVRLFDDMFEIASQNYRNHMKDHMEVPD